MAQPSPPAPQAGEGRKPSKNNKAENQNQSGLFEGDEA
jgi:hypothetical protein